VSQFIGRYRIPDRGQMTTIRRLVPIAAVFLGVLSSIPSPAAAQPAAAQSFSELSGRLKLNDRVHVTDAEGQHVVGIVLSISDTGLRLRLNDRSDRSFLPADVSIVYKEHRYTRRGVIAGGAVGVSAGLLGLLEACNQGTSCESHMSKAAAVTGLFGSIGGGALFGGTIGSLYARFEPVYTAPGAGAQRHVALQPLVCPRRQGVLLSIRF
jgi:hypothetical protein